MKTAKNSLIGKTYEEVITLLDVPVRIAHKDGQDFMLTRDYNPDRINLKIKDGKIIEVYNG